MLCKSNEIENVGSLVANSCCFGGVYTGLMHLLRSEIGFPVLVERFGQGLRFWRFRKLQSDTQLSR